MNSYAQSESSEAIESQPKPKSSTPFALNWIMDGILLGVGTATTISTFLLPEKSKGLGVVYKDKLDINGLDQLFMFPYSNPLKFTGDVFMGVSLALPLVLLAIPEKKELLTVAVMYIETLLLSHATKEFIKFGVDRYRPYTYFTYPEGVKLPSEKEDRKSLPSGHTTFAFAGASFTSYVFAMYFPKSFWNIPVSVGAFSLAAMTATYRILSGHHFLTDVFAGALIGTLYGIGVPLLHTFNKKMEKNNMNVAFVPNGLHVRYSY
ncbi:MAG: phosphatase PAP2 family protein [Treponemataceae bacterium]